MPLPVRLVCELISRDGDLLGRAGQLLSRAFGPIELESEIAAPPGDASEISEITSGENDLVRGVVSFARPIEPGALAGAQREAWEVEQRILDDLAALETDFAMHILMGYVHPTKLVTAARADAPQRIYLAAGVYAEITLSREDSNWQAHPWTLPRHADPTFISFIETVRAAGER